MWSQNPRTYTSITSIKTISPLAEDEERQQQEHEHDTGKRRAGAGEGRRMDQKEESADVGTL